MKDQELLDLLFTSDWTEKYTEKQYVYLLREYKKLVHRVCNHNKNMENEISFLKKEIEDLKEQNQTINKNLIQISNKLDWYRAKYEHRLSWWERISGKVKKDI